MFCPKCGSILLVKEDKGKKKMVCKCGYSSEDTDMGRVTIKGEEAKEIEVVNDDEAIKTLPATDAECPKCGHGKAYYWLIQTRAGDEPETKFLKCEKCGHTWRDYD